MRPRPTAGGSVPGSGRGAWPGPIGEQAHPKLRRPACSSDPRPLGRSPRPPGPASRRRPAHPAPRVSGRTQRARARRPAAAFKNPTLLPAPHSRHRLTWLREAPAAATQQLRQDHRCSRRVDPQGGQRHGQQRHGGPDPAASAPPARLLAGLGAAPPEGPTRRPRPAPAPARPQPRPAEARHGPRRPCPLPRLALRPECRPGLGRGPHPRWDRSRIADLTHTPAV